MHCVQEIMAIDKGLQVIITMYVIHTLYYYNVCYKWVDAEKFQCIIYNLWGEVSKRI